MGYREIRGRIGLSALPRRGAVLAAASAGLLFVGFAAMSTAAAAFPNPGFSYLSHFSTVTSIASTVPANGDENPYGIVVVPQTVGRLVAGDTLVSNFNNSANLQGLGSTIVEVAPSGGVTTFSHLHRRSLPGPCPGGVGLTTALTTLPGGWVVVGSLPTRNGRSATMKAGCLIVLNSAGMPVETWSGGDINGPWDLTAASAFGGAELFVTNVLNGTVAHSPATVNQGTVVRLDIRLSGTGIPQLTGSTVIANGFAERTDPNALVVGPTGLALGNQGQLYVADTVNSRIAVVPFATWRWQPMTDGGYTISSGGDLNGPLGLVMAPNGDVIAANGGNGDLVEVTPFGGQVASPQVIPAGAGDLFGLTIAPYDRGVLFVNDGDNTLDLFGPSSSK
jgi:hypothetical protein